MKHLKRFACDDEIVVASEAVLGYETVKFAISGPLVSDYAGRRAKGRYAGGPGPLVAAGLQGH